jgi:DNA-binding CsgD family transcriptional regulator
VLTDRERQVLGLVAGGCTNAEIGEQLFITTGTAKVHVARLLYKLGARDRVQLVIIAHKAGLAPGPIARRSGARWVRPSARTVTRSPMRRISSRRCEM